MEISDLLAALDRDGVAFVGACEAAPAGATVPACPEWDVADLLWHLTEVHDFWCSIVAGLLQSPESYEQPPRPANTELAAMYRSGLSRLLAVLDAADPASALWTWTGPRDVAWVVRRMAHETAVHRWDAEQVAARDMPIEAALASDGIDEFLHVFLPWGADRSTLTGSAHLHCTDVAGEWTARPVAGAAPEVTREHTKGDCALRGPASDLLLALWRRVGIEQLDVVGDATVAASFLAYTPTS